MELQIRSLFQTPKIFDRIARAKGPLAFIDESFRAPSQDHDSFYIVAAAVIDKAIVLEVRKELRRRVRHGTWHTTEAGRSQVGQQKIRELSAYLATVVKPVVVVVDQLQKSDRSAEAGRAKALRALLVELATEHVYLTGTVVYEKRIPGYMQAHDDLIIGQIRREKGAASSLNVIGLSTKSEPLLWIPDIIAWAFRQQYLKDGGGYFSELAKIAKVIHI
ncbi:hypothetical protein HRU87_01865 [Aquiluna borgnonia]|uniref:DUF3800 domain-containing protein n=1 Tax=Aquiluna borgnonia TaxID=2499157 RepID=A0A7D4TQZ9_9MICO|nr:hypothetical protein [Aquiluna borgnonia]QKJ24973.1 hypothetical protein HRU87_01865 [Aquiluna borgnonia]